MGVKKIVIL
ncbi:hypothetical protein ECTW09195_5887, partial [Escherichia coli TW09195]